MPRARIYLINKHTPKLREECFYSLSQAANQCSLPTRIGCRDQQSRSFNSQLLRYLFASIAKVAKRYSSISHKRERKRRFPAIDIACCQHCCQEMPVDIYRSVQLEAEEPSFAGFPKVCPILSEQPHTSVSNGATNGYRFRVEDRQLHFKAVRVASRF